MRGRKPDPTALRVLRGNPGRRPLPANEPAPAVFAEAPPPPEWLGDAEKVEWSRVGPTLASNGLLTELDLDALAAYCAAVVTWKAATAELRKAGGLTITSPNGYAVQSPFVAIANGAMATMKGLLTEFGMTPSARSRVAKAAAPPKAAANPLDRFLNRKRT